MLGRYATAAGQRLGARFQFDQQVTAHYFQARILWLLGFADQAMRIVEHNIEEGHSIGNALSLGSVLGQGACPIALLCGDLDCRRSATARCCSIMPAATRCGTGRPGHAASTVS